MRWPGGRRDTLPVVELRRRRRSPHGRKLDRALDRIGQRVEPTVDIVRLVRLHQAEMTFRQLEAHVVAKRAEHFQPDTLEARRDQGEMARARDPIEDHAGDGDVVAIVRQARSNGRRRLGLAGDVEHQQHRPAEQRREIGRGPACRLTGGGNAVEQAHHALGDGDVGGMACHEVAKRRRAPSPRCRD